MRSKTKRILALLCAVVLVATTFLGNTYMKQGEVKAADSVEPISLDGFDNITISDFVDSSGNPMPTGEYSSGVDTGFKDTGAAKLASNASCYTVPGLSNFDNKLVSMKVKFSGVNFRQSIVFGGTGFWTKVFNLHTNESGNELVIERSWGSEISGSSVHQKMSAETAGVTSFTSAEGFILQMSFEYGKVSENNTADLKLGIYINGKLYGNQKFTISSCNMDYAAATLGVYLEEVEDVATVMSLDNVEWPAEPVRLEGYTNLTLNDFVDNSGNMLADGEYTHGTAAVYHAANVSNFDNVLLSMKIKFNTANYRTSMTFGGNGEWCGMNLHPASNGEQLVLDTSWAGSYASYSPITMYASTAGVDSFLDNEFLLQISFDYTDLTATTTDLTIGFYIEGKLYDNQTYTISNCQVANVANYLSLYREASGQSISVKSVELRKEPIVVDGFDNITIADFTDKNDGTGNELHEGTYEGTNCYPYYLKNATNFNNKLLSMYVTFNGGGSYKNCLTVAGLSAYDSFSVGPNNHTGTALTFNGVGAWSGQITSSGSVSVTAAEAGVSSFVNNEFLLQLSFSYGEETDGYANLTIGFYIDGKECGTFTIEKCNMSHTGNALSLISENDTNPVVERSITVGDVKFGKFAGYTEVTVEDFVDGSGNVMESKAYQCADPINGTMDDFVLADGTSFHKKLISMNVKFNHDGTNTWNTRIDVGRDSEGAWEGFSLYTNGTGSALTLTDMYDKCAKDSSGNRDTKSMLASTAGISSFLKNQFLLQMTFDIGDFDGEADTDDIQIGVYINGTLYNDEKFIFYDCTAYGNHIGLYRQADYSTIIVGSINEEFPEDPGIQPSARYEKLTFGHFGIVNKTYPCKPGDLAVYGPASGKTNLDKTVISGDIFLEGGNSSIIIWGGLGGWNGLRMYASVDSMGLAWIDSSDKQVWSADALNSTTAGVKFVGEKYNLKLSAEIIADGEDKVANDLKIGIWFNNVLYNQEYFIATDIGTDAYFGNYFSVYCPNDGDQVTFGSEMNLLEQPNADFEWITYSLFGIDDGKYGCITPNMAVEGTYRQADTLDKTVICGDVKLSGTGLFQYIVGGKDDVWDGMRFMVGSADTMNLYWYPDNLHCKTFNAKTAGVSFEDEEFNLMMSIEVLDYDGDGGSDIKLGVWFNGFLYEDDYIIIRDKGAELGGQLGVYAEKENDYVVLNSIQEYSKRPDPTFDKITFSDFGLETQEVTCGANVVASGKASAYTTLDRVVFSGDFRMSDAGDYQIIYGGDAGWSGLRFIIDSSGNMNVYWYKGNENQYVAYVTPEYAGVTSFIQNTFNLMVSTELVDDDGVGNKNDIKVGIWFNEVLYEYEGREYQIVKDWGDQLLNGFSIYGASGSASSVLIRNVDSYQRNPYYYEADEVTSYRESGTYPEEPGYVFAGWYKDAEYTEWINKDETGTSAWAKFLEDDVLSVQSQVKVTTTDDDGDGKLDVTSNSTDLRVATTVDGLEYRRISFYLQKQQANGNYGTKFNTATSDENARMVYEKLYALEDKTTVTEHKPTIFTWQSDYFKTFTITGIPSSDYGTKIKVTPYWITMDGTLVEGKAVETCVDDYTNNISKSVSVDFIGDDTLPITGYHGPYVVSNANDAMLFPDYITDEYFKLIADSGVNVIISSNLDYARYPIKMKKALELGEKYGVGIYVQDSTLLTLTTVDKVKARLAEYDDYESFVGIYLVDEPGTSEFQSSSSAGLVSEYSTLAGFLSELEILTYANMYPIVDSTKWYEVWTSDEEKYQAYVSTVNSDLKPAVLMWDYYPFAVKWNDDGTIAETVTTSHSEYFWNMGEIRRQAQATNKPFWAYVQAGANWNDASIYFDTKVYAPSVEQFKWNMNTALAFGAQGIQYFPLIQPYHFAYAGSSAEDKVWDFERNGLIGAFGNPTEWYGYAQEANAHVAAMDHILMNSYSEQIIALGDAATDTSDLISDTNMDVTKSASYKKLTSVSDGANVLIGCFDYKGKTALYVVNYDYNAEQNGITLNFEGTSNITKYENATETNETASSITLNMEAGEGILLVIE